MAKPLDLTGKRFGLLTVKSLADPYVLPSGEKKRRWLCECDCGNEIAVMQTHLTTGNTKSCGCLQRAKVEDLTGRNFGDLEVLGPTELEPPESGRQRLGWLCRCKCGKEFATTRNELMYGRKSCGCQSEPADLSGQEFGWLTAKHLVDPYVSPSGQPYRRWLCQCRCGNKVEVLQIQLTSGKTRSCGCSRREAILNKTQDMTGMRFGKLEVLGRVDLERPCTNRQRSGWLCRCDCGNEVVVIRKDLLSGKVQSCGCLLRETARKRIVEQNAVGHYAGTTISTINPDRPPNKNNKSGVKGVFWSEREQRWIASITVKRKSIKIGRFRTLEEAAKARKEAEEKYFAPLIEEYKQLKEGKNDEKA